MLLIEIRPTINQGYLHSKRVSENGNALLESSHTLAMVMFNFVVLTKERGRETKRKRENENESVCNLTHWKIKLYSE